MAHLTIIESEDVRAALLPSLGAGIADLALRGPGGAWFPLLRRAIPSPTHFNELACYALAPWSNRIPEGRFEFRGRRVELRPNWPDGTAIHGEVNGRPWRLLDRSPVSASFELLMTPTPGTWPWAYRAIARYEVGPGQMRAVLEVTNLDADAMPVGLGFHPFFVRRLWSVEDRPVVTLPNRGRYPAARMIPTAGAAMDACSRSLEAGRTLDEVALDDVFLGSPDGATIVWPASGVRVRMDSGGSAGHSVVYSPVAKGGAVPYLCVEPVTMVNDGLGRQARGEVGTGVQVLEPGEHATLRMDLSITTVL